MRIGVCLCGCMLAGCARNFPVAIRDEEIAAFSMLAANLSRAAVPAVICQNRGFCYIFWSASTYNGQPSPVGPAGMDARCNADGNKPNTSQYKALLSGGTRRATTTANLGDGQLDWVLYASMTYKRPDGTLIGSTNAAKLLIFPLTNGISPSAGSGTWTGMNIDWTDNTDICTGWTSTGGFGTIGTATSTTTGALYQTNAQGCGAVIFNIYCVEQ